jgi:hypothetical protein
VGLLYNSFLNILLQYYSLTFYGYIFAQKKMKKLFLTLSLSAALVFFAAAQNKTSTTLDYKTSIGLKIWDGAGISLKTFIDKKNAAEFIGFFKSGVTRITGLYEIHGELNTEGNLKWYFGPGAHVGLYKINSNNYTYFGIDGVVGLDYKFANLPLNLSLDWQPAFEFSGGGTFAGDWGGFGIRYTL